MEKYCIKIGERYLSWVDEHWYETTSVCHTYFDSITEIKNVITLLKNHYVYKTVVCEITKRFKTDGTFAGFDFTDMKPIKLYEPPKPDSYFGQLKSEPLKLKCVINITKN